MWPFLCAWTFVSVMVSFQPAFKSAELDDEDPDTEWNTTCIICSVVLPLYSMHPHIHEHHDPLKLRDCDCNVLAPAHSYKLSRQQTHTAIQRLDVHVVITRYGEHEHEPLELKRQR